MTRHEKQQDKDEVSEQCGREKKDKFGKRRREQERQPEKKKNTW